MEALPPMLTNPSQPILTARCLPFVLSTTAVESEKKLPSSQECWLHALIEVVDRSVLLKDPLGRWLIANGETLRLFGLEGVDYQGKTNAELAPYTDQYRRPSLLNFAATDEWVWESGVANCSQEMIQTPDGIILVEVKKVPLFCANGSRQGLLVYGSEMGEDSKGEKDLSKATFEPSEARYRMVVEDQTDLIMRSSPEGKITFVNQAFCRYLNQTPEQLIGWDFIETVPYYNREQVRQHFAALSQDNPVAGIEQEVCLPGGEVRTHDWTSCAIFDRLGNLIEYQSVGRDITDRKIIEQALRESEERYRTLVNTIPLMIWGTEIEGGCDFFNDNWLEFVGRSLEEESGKGWLLGVHPSDRQFCVDTDRSNFSHHLPFEMEYRVRRADGEYRWVLDKGVPRFSLEGNFEGYIGVCLDITKRKTAEEALTASEAKNRALIDAIPDLLLRFRRDGTILEQKTPKWMPIPTFVEVGKIPQAFVPPELAKESFETIERAFTTGELQTWEYQIEVQGEWRYREARIVAYTEAEALAIIRDISERKVSEAGFYQQQQEWITLVENSPDLIIRFDRSHCCLYVNSVIETAMGISAQAFIGKTSRELGMLQEQVALCESTRARVFETGTEAIVEFDFSSPSSICFYQARYVPEFSASGTVETILCVARDITDLKQAQVELLQSNQKLSLHLQQTLMAVIEWSTNWEITDWNPAAERIFGFSKDEALGLNADGFIPEAAIAQVNQVRQSLFTLSGGTRSINENITKSGKIITCDWYNTALVNPVGEVIGYASLAQDITEQVLLEETLRQQAQREQLSAAIQSRLRASLNLEEILNVAVSEVQQLLKCDRVLIYRLFPDGTGQVITEAVLTEWTALLGQSFGEEVFPESCYKNYKQGGVRILDLKSSDTEPCLVEMFHPFGVKTKLIAPLLQKSPPLNVANQEELEATLSPKIPNSDLQLWGLLVAHQCRSGREWQPFEIDLLQQLSVQLAIGIQQAQLYQQLEVANQELSSLACLDGLTKVANRRSFDECLEQEWRRGAREQAPLALILCDIDFFKLYNDTYGHLAGDFCLQRVAGVIKESAMRPADVVARYGGEEFVVILPNTKAEGAVQVAEAIRTKLKALQIPHTAAEFSPYVTLSLGVAIAIPDVHRSPLEMIMAADEALYEAKNRGRDRAILKIC